MADVIYTDSESQVTIETGDDAVSVLLSASEAGSSVTTTAPSSIEHVTNTADPVVIVSREETTSIINSVGIGPQGIQGIQGIPGEDGTDGVDAVGAIPGDITGDFLRWNEEDNAWEVKSEPIEFKQIVLTPAVAALLDKEGGLWYDSVNKSVMVCTDDH